MSTSRKESAENDMVEVVADQPSAPDSKPTVIGRCHSYIRTCWLVETFRTLLRTLGLSIVTFLGGNDPEPSKVLIDSSRKLALARCAVHIVPAFLSIALITLNLLGFFIGNELQGDQDQDDLKFGLLQVAAKLQELLIVASVGSVIFHILRSELVFGDGVTLGLLVSGFSFSQISYFVSPEFVGSLGWGCGHGENMAHGQRAKRLGFILLLIVGGALALLAGPAAAVLMIPRRMDWPVGGGVYWLNGSDDQLWPKFLDAAYYSQIDCTLEAGQFTDNRCPSHGFLPMYQHFTSWWNGYGAGYTFELNDGFQRKIIYARPALISEANTWVYSAHAATAVLQDAMREWASPKRYEVLTKAPATRVFCELQGIMDLDDRNLTVRFPNLKGLDKYWEDNAPAEVREVHGAELLDQVELLTDVKRALATRGILEDEKSTLNNSIFDDRRDVLIAATDIWDDTKNSLGLVILFKDLFNRTNVNANISPPSNVVACSIDGRVLNLINTELTFKDRMGYIFAPPPPSPEMEDIRLTTDWYNMLSPTLPDTPPDNLPWLSIQGSKRTTLETLLISIYSENFRQTELENLIATFFVDGLSRSGLAPNYGATRFLEAWPFGEFEINNTEMTRKLLHRGDPIEIFPEPAILKSGNATRMVMKAIYSGYVMTSQNWFDKPCIAGLILHAVIALVHTILVVIMGKTGGAWDSILELIALTQRSTPPEESLLSGTSAGVRSLKTVKLIAWVEAPEAGATTALEDKKVPGGELQMRFKERSDKRDEALKPTVDKMYGVPRVTRQGYQPVATGDTV
ncbi:hypothetical protein NCS52_00772200 [Fusarium sp. LHS14.1]|nr:hypothetical protein NCS52_00772200 [Fusarium sp. LHS14.1]